MTYITTSASVGDGDKGDVVVTGGGAVWTIDVDVVTNAKLADMAANSIKGNNTGGAANPLDLTVTEVTAMLNVLTAALKGLAPASGGGTTNFLRADASWAVPPGTPATITLTGDVTGSGTGTFETRLALAPFLLMGA